MSTGDWLALISALSAALSVLIPFIIKWFEKKSKLHQSIYFLELIKTQEQLITLKENQEENEISVINSKISSLLFSINKEINKIDNKYSFAYFISLVIIEALLFLSALFFQISDSMTKLLKGKSYETGMYFLEGIFKHQEMRIILMAIFISISVYFTTTLSDKVFMLLKNNLFANGVLLLIFNILFIIITSVGVVTLFVLDPIVPIW